MPDSPTFITAEDLRMREGTDKTFPIVTTIPAGEIVSVLDQLHEKWWKVSYKTHQGFSSKKYLLGLKEISLKDKIITAYDCWVNERFQKGVELYTELANLDADNKEYYQFKILECQSKLAPDKGKIIAQAKEMISQGNLKEAIDFIEDFCSKDEKYKEFSSNLITLEGNFMSAKKQLSLMLITPADFQMTQARVNLGLVTLLEEIESVS